MLPFPIHSCLFPSIYFSQPKSFRYNKTETNMEPNPNAESAGSTSSNPVPLNTQYKLRGIMDGDDSSFEVDVMNYNTIGVLKWFIRERKKPDLDDTAADKLILFKIVSENFEGKGNVVNLSDVECKLIKDNADLVDEHFGGSSAGKAINIIVQKPPQGMSYINDSDD